MRRDSQTFRQVFEAVRTFLSAHFDGGQDFSSGVNCLQDEGYQEWIEFPLTIAQLAQEALGLMRDPLQRRKREEAARALDGVNGAENACQQGPVFRVLLELDKLLIQLREVFVTLDQKFVNHVLILHSLVLHARQKTVLCRISLVDTALPLDFRVFLSVKRYVDTQGIHRRVAWELYMDLPSFQQVAGADVAVALSVPADEGTLCFWLPGRTDARFPRS